MCVCVCVCTHACAHVDACVKDSSILIHASVRLNREKIAMFSHTDRTDPSAPAFQRNNSFCGTRDAIM